VAGEPAGLAELVGRALAEDIGRGDVTTRLTVPAGTRATARLVQKSAGVLAGAPVFEAAFAVHAPGAVAIAWLAEEGSAGARRDVARLAGPARALLTAERVALNFLQRLSGVATLARQAATVTDGTQAVVLDTRKTTPGLRLAEKYAVRVGGGRNHRFGLDDGVLIKDNHIAAAGGIRRAVEAARAGCPPGLKIEVEVTDLNGLETAIDAGADIVLLDNMAPETVRVAVARAAGRVRLEASGGLTPENLADYATTGVDYLSLGSLTHSARAVDFSLELELELDRDPDGEAERTLNREMER
jgi:nicotinate-nucleotide pyrophosphorylase (carboxylating)